MKWSFFVLISAVLFSCGQTSHRHRPVIDSAYYNEVHRPQFHFSPPKNWMNDPNGLVYYEGEYHLFYQHNPYGVTWGHMSWGHAVSRDLLHWEHLPVALEEYKDASGDSTMIFSGTVVVDSHNSSGLCEDKDCLVALYTSSVHRGNEGVVQHQSLAYSNDKGRSWKRYDKNPVLDIGRKDFRDPKVFWHEGQKRWIMALVIPDQFKVCFYQSTNLIAWDKLSEFGGMGDTTRVWECPDLYELPVENQSGKSKWVLSLSGSHPQGPGFVGMQYFVGQFDGTSFIPDDPAQPPLYVDYGKDFYAGIVYNNMPPESNRTIMIGWVNNWTYGNEIPTAPWRGAASIPRELSLRETTDGIRLVQRPLRAIYSLRGREIIDLTQAMGKSVELDVEINPYDAKMAEIRILQNGDEETVIGYDIAAGEVFLDRRHSGDTHSRDFASVERTKIQAVEGIIKLSIFVDNSIVEVFVNGGEKVITEQVFPTHKMAFLKTYSDNGKAAFTVLAWEVKSVWRDPMAP